MKNSKQNMIMFENEASLRGEGCTVPPKPCNTGRLLNNKIVRYVPISQNLIHLQRDRHASFGENRQDAAQKRVE